MTEMTQEDFRREIARQRTAGRSMADIARELCVTRQAVFCWLQGGSPSRMVLKLAARAGWGSNAGAWPTLEPSSNPAESDTLS